jgi:[acyl-carrier-protein] S-malonyltransferase
MTKKSITLLFPGQGSQYVGMGKNLENDTSFELFNSANKKLGYSLTQIMMEGPIEDLTLTSNAQPAIVSYSIALFQKLSQFLEGKDVTIHSVLGHSVGEYSALVAAGVINFEDAVYAVHKRGEFMQAAVPVGKGSMHAIMKVPGEVIEKACQEVSNDEYQVTPANFNEPNQIVISGHKEACAAAIEWIEKNHEGAFRQVELKVSAPFHSPLMKTAAENLEAELEKIPFQNSKLPYIANIDAQQYVVETEGNTIKRNLIKQVAGTVRWTQSFAQLPEDTLCIEVGPGRILAGLARKINPNIKVVSLDREGAFEQIEEYLA